MAPPRRAVATLQRRTAAPPRSVCGCGERRGCLRCRDGYATVNERFQKQRRLASRIAELARVEAQLAAKDYPVVLRRPAAGRDPAPPRRRPVSPRMSGAGPGPRRGAWFGCAGNVGRPGGNPCLTLTRGARRALVPDGVGAEAGRRTARGEYPGPAAAPGRRCTTAASSSKSASTNARAVRARRRDRRPTARAGCAPTCGSRGSGRPAEVAGAGHGAGRRRGRGRPERRPPRRHPGRHRREPGRPPRPRPARTWPARRPRPATGGCGPRSPRARAREGHRGDRGRGRGPRLRRFQDTREVRSPQGSSATPFTGSPPPSSRTGSSRWPPPRAGRDRGRPALHLQVRRRVLAACPVHPHRLSRPGTKVPRSRSDAEPSGTASPPAPGPRPGKPPQRPVPHQSDGSSAPHTAAGQGRATTDDGRGQHPGTAPNNHQFTHDSPPGAHPDSSGVVTPGGLSELVQAGHRFPGDPPPGVSQNGHAGVFTRDHTLLPNLGRREQVAVLARPASSTSS